METPFADIPNYRPRDSSSDISTPKVLGMFSISDDGEFCEFNCNQLKYYNIVKEYSIIEKFGPLHLVPDFSITDTKAKIAFNMDNLMVYIANYRQIFPKIFNNTPLWSLSKVPIITHEDLLVQIASLPFIEHDYEIPTTTKFKVACVLFKGAIYMTKITNDTKWKVWTKSLEQKILSDNPNRFGGAKISPESYSNIYQTELGSHTLIYTAFISAMIVDKRNAWPLKNESNKRAVKTLNASDFTQVKISIYPSSEGQKKNFETNTSLLWYLESIFSKIKYVTCGFSRNGKNVAHVTNFDKTDLIICGSMRWKPKTCMEFCDGFFSYVKIHMKREMQRLFPDITCDHDLKRLPKIVIGFEFADNNVKLFRDAQCDNIPTWFEDVMNEHVK